MAGCLTQLCLQKLPVAGMRYALSTQGSSECAHMTYSLAQAAADDGAAAGALNGTELLTLLVLKLPLLLLLLLLTLLMRLCCIS